MDVLFRVPGLRTRCVCKQQEYLEDNHRGSSAFRGKHEILLKMDCSVGSVNRQSAYYLPER